MTPLEREKRKLTEIEINDKRFPTENGSSAIPTEENPAEQNSCLKEEQDSK